MVIWRDDISSAGALPARGQFCPDGNDRARYGDPSYGVSQKKLKALLEDIDQRIESYLGTLAEADRAEEQSGGSAVSASELQAKISTLKERRGRYRELLDALEQSGDTQVSLSDPDSRAMSQGAGVTVGYNVQATRPSTSHRYSPPPPRLSMPSIA